MVTASVVASLGLVLAACAGPSGMSSPASRPGLPGTSGSTPTGTAATVIPATTTTTTGGPTTTTTTVTPATVTPPPTGGPASTAPTGAPGSTAPTGAPGNPAPVLRPGSSGPAVAALQARLASLGYWVGTDDGVFGDSTEQAVYALQKAAGIAVDGDVGPATEAAADQGALPRPRSSSGYVIEVDLQDDLLMVVTSGAVRWVLNTSTGGGYTYSDAGVTAVAATPVGEFHIQREVDGLVTDSLGSLWRPKYFDAGFAIHGDSYVPPVPVSHGCVRVSDEAIDWIWSTNVAPIGTEVWVY
ncbi:MAG TPA: L,D-transpeptidase family protein [Acidimicrobiales bacterium]|nr:L,D-transpeptidase family protein [Acidimicrobiales bacterium]